MRQTFIITEKLWQNEQGLCLQDHKQRVLILLADKTQRVNCTSLQLQQFPCVVLSDQEAKCSESGQYHLSADAMISILPISSEKVSALLDAGCADQLLTML